MLEYQSLRTNANVTVLLVDDEIKLLEALRKYLESRNISVLIANSTAEAITVLKNKIPDIFIIANIISPKEPMNLSNFSFVFNAYVFNDFFIVL